MRSFVEELKGRSYPLFILGLLFFLCAFFCGSFIFLEKNRLGESLPFRTALSALYTAIMLWSIGWMNEYLYHKQARKFFGTVYLFIHLLFLFIIVTTVLRGVQPNPHAELPLDRLNFQLYMIAEA